LAATTRLTVIVAGKAAAGRVSSGSASPSAPTVVRPPVAVRRSRSSPGPAKKRSSEAWASSGVVAVIVRHQRPHT